MKEKYHAIIASTRNALAAQRWAKVLWGGDWIVKQIDEYGCEVYRVPHDGCPRCDKCPCPGCNVT